MAARGRRRAPHEPKDPTPTPQCPRCRERLSSAEIGFNGLWSCLYCEGVWLPYAQVESLAHSAGVNLTRYMAPAEGSSARKADLLCPKCLSPSFVGLAAKGANLSSCSSCRGLYIPKAAFDLFAVHLGTKQKGLATRVVRPPTARDERAYSVLSFAIALLDIFSP